MKNLNNRGEFESQLQNKFEGAEMTPSDNLWSRIDADLANDKAAGYRRKLFFYQMVAAASLLLVVGFVSANLWLNYGNTDQPALSETRSADENNRRNDTSTKGDIQKPKGPELQDNTTGPVLADEDIVKEKNKTMVLALTENANRDYHAFIADIETAERTENLIQLPAQLHRKPVAEIDAIEAPVLANVFTVPTIKSMAIIPSSKKEENFWTGINFSSGLFDAGYTETTAAASTVSTSIVRDASTAIPASASFRTLAAAESVSQSPEQNPQVQTGISYSAGLNGGFLLGKRWRIETGFMYTQNNNTSQTSVIVERRNNNVAFPLTMSNMSDQDFNLSRVSYTNEDITLDNTYEFVSIPLKAGYVVLQSDLSIALSAGFSADMFLQNSVKNHHQDLEDFTVKPGAQSPYRDVYFNGLVSTQIMYQLPGLNYSIMVEPMYTVALNHMTRDEYYVNSRPRTFMLGVGLRYHFR